MASGAAGESNAADDGAPVRLTYVVVTVTDLVKNACEAMQSGGELRIGTRVLGFDEIIGTLHPSPRPGPHVLLTIHDTVHAMDVATRSRMCSPEPPNQGGGLGLWPAYWMVREMGGHISVSSAVGRGTTVNVILPAAPDAPT